jgi:hypothetical protein
VTTAKDDKALKREAYGAATSKLRDKYRDEFNELMAEEARARSIEWSPRLSEVEKAERQIADLLALHPELAARFSDAPQ